MSCNDVTPEDNRSQETVAAISVGNCLDITTTRYQPRSLEISNKAREDGARLSINALD